MRLIATGIANTIDATSKMDKPVIITGFLPILSDKDPIKGERLMYTTFEIKYKIGMKNSANK